jgi:hypothetical protein
MNDTELDELLDKWKAPSPTESFRNDFRAKLVPKLRRSPRRFLGRWKLATAAVVIVAFFLVGPAAFSTRLPRYTVDSEINHYDGAMRWTEWPRHILMTSYSDAGSEVILSWSFPHHPLDTTYIKMLILAEERSDSLKRRFQRIVKSYIDWKKGVRMPVSDPTAFAYLTDPDEKFYVGSRKALVSSGCRSLRGESREVGQDVLLNYATTVVQLHQDKGRSGWERKITIWMAPELSCSVLQSIVEIPEAGGWKVVTERKALKVHVNQ